MSDSWTTPTTVHRGFFFSGIALFIVFLLLNTARYSTQSRHTEIATQSKAATDLDQELHQHHQLFLSIISPIQNLTSPQKTPSGGSFASLPQQVRSSVWASDRALRNQIAQERQRTIHNQIQIFDFLMINDEMDSLEIRLEELADLVDVFYVVESATTFSGRPKPLYFYENEDRFRKFRHKIVYIQIPDIDSEAFNYYKSRGVGGWTQEYYTRDKAFKLALTIRKPRERDWIIMSDLDEVPRRSFLKALKNPDPETVMGQKLMEGTPTSEGDVIRLSCGHYFFSFEYRAYNRWHGPLLVRFRDRESEMLSRDISKFVAFSRESSLPWVAEKNWTMAGQRLRDLRSQGHIPIIQDQCYHCTWCFPNLTQVVRKIDSWSHTEYNHPKFKDRAYILNHFREGVDLFERHTEELDYIPLNRDVPRYIWNNMEKFSFMLKRKNLPNAGFLDVNPDNPLDE